MCVCLNFEAFLMVFSLEYLQNFAAIRQIF